MKILHVDSHAIFRTGIRCILKPLDHNIEFLEASNLKMALPVVLAHQDINLVLVECSLTDNFALDTLDKLHSYIPTTPVVALTAAQNTTSIKIAQKIGLAGYIPKSATSSTLIRALQAVLQGGRYMPRTSNLHALPGKNPSPPLPHKLTKRQSEVLTLIAEGLPNKAIAHKLNVSEATVKGHVTAILMALGVNNRVQAINRWRDVVNDLKLAS